MKGTVFIALNDMLEENYGIDVWEQLLETVKPPSQGIYTSTEDYSEKEMYDFVVAISNMLNLPQQEVVRTFGTYLFAELNRKHPIFTQINNSFFPFLNSINGVIHKEVKKLYNEPSLPMIGCEQISDHQMEMFYHSQRKLCFLAEGLIYGAAKHFNHHIEINHEICMHSGDDHCLLKISLLDSGQTS